MAPIADRLCPVRHVSLCPQMDLIALVDQEGSLVVFRTTSWQRLMAPMEAGPSGAISALCWSPTGREVATGHANGSLRVIEVEQDAEVRDEFLGASGALSSLELGARVDVMTWTAYLDTTAAESEDLLESCRLGALKISSGYLERGEALMPLPEDPIGDSVVRRVSRRDEMFEGYRSVDLASLSLLVTIDARFTAVLSLEGQFAVARIDLSSSFPSGAPAEAKTAALTADLARLVVWGGPHHSDAGGGGRLSSFSIQAMRETRLELSPLSRHFFGVSSMLETARDALTAARHKYLDFLQALDSAVFEPYAAAMVALDDEGKLVHRTTSDKLAERPRHVNVAEDLLLSLAVGLGSLAHPETLFGKLVPSEAGMLKLHKQLDATLGEAVAAFDARLLRAARHLFYRASELEGLARAGDVTGYDRAGLDVAETQRFLKACELLVLKAELCVESLRACRDRWLILAAWLADCAMMYAARLEFSKLHAAAAADDDDQGPHAAAAAAAALKVPLAATTPKTHRHKLDELMGWLRHSLRSAQEGGERSRDSIAERILLGPVDLGRHLCDPPDDEEEQPSSSSDEARFLLGNLNGYDVSRRDTPVTEPSRADLPLSLCGRLRECCELADAIFARVRTEFAGRISTRIPAYDLRLDGAPTLDVALHARLSDRDDDPGDRLVCAVATAQRNVWLLDLRPDAAVSARRFALDPALSLVALDFYGAQAGYRTKNGEKLVLLVRSAAGDDARGEQEPEEEEEDKIIIVDDEALLRGTAVFELAQPIPDLAAPPPTHLSWVSSRLRPPQLGGGEQQDQPPQAAAPPAAAATNDDDDALVVVPIVLPEDQTAATDLPPPLVPPDSPDLADLVGVLPMIHKESSRLFVCGCRGVAAVVARPNLLTLYDLEDLDDDDDDDDDDEEEDDDDEEVGDAGDEEGARQAEEEEEDADGDAMVEDADI